MHRPSAGAIQLEPLGMQHLDALSDMAYAQDLWAYHTVRVDSHDALVRYVDDGMAERRAMRAYPFAVLDREKQQYAGCCRLETFDWKDMNLDCGHAWLGKGHRGGGLSTAMALALLGFAFETLGMERVATRCDARNAHALKRLEKLGIHLEGRLRSHCCNWDGYRRDSILYSVLRHEWPALKDRWTRELGLHTQPG